MENKLSEILEALLLSASRPISIEDMAKVFDEPKPSKDDIRNALNQIDEIDMLLAKVMHELKKTHNFGKLDNELIISMDLFDRISFSATPTKINILFSFSISL